MNNPERIPDILERMAGEIVRQVEQTGRHDPAMIGIHTGGVWVAAKLHELLAIPVPLGSLDISFYRDDFTRIGMNPVVRPSQLPFSIDDRHIILVDDVLHTGRTIRAAMNELFDYGRPASILLATLVERSVCRPGPPVCYAVRRAVSRSGRERCWQKTRLAES